MAPDAPAGAALSAAEEAYQAARAAVAHYRLPEARARLEEARRHLDGQPGAAGRELGLRVRLTGSWLTCDADGLPAALAEIDAALAEASAAGLAAVEALAHVQAGVLLARAGSIDKALARLRPAVERSAALPVDDRVRLLLNKGTIGSRAGALDEAAGDLRAAASLARDLPEYRFMALHNLGYVEFLRGELPAALGTMAEADGMDADVDRAVARHDRARVLMEAGLLEDAEGLLERAAGELRAGGLAQEYGEARLDRARCAALAGRGAEALRIAGEVAAEAAARGERARELEARAVALEARLLTPGAGDPAGGPVEGAPSGGGPGLPAPDRGEPGPRAADPDGPRDPVGEAAALAAAARAARNPWLEDRAAALQVVAAAQAGNPGATAGDDVRRSLRRMRRSPLLATRALAILAQLRLAPDPAARSRLVRAAVDELAAARGGMASLDLRTAVAVHLAPVLAEDLARAANSTGWAALRATERWRAALDSVPSVVPPADPALAGRWSTLRRRHEELRTAGPDEAPALRAEVSRIERELREGFWARRAAAPVGRRASPARARLGGARVLSYFWSGGRLHLVDLRPGRPAALLRLGRRAEVADLVARATADASAAAQAPPGPLGAAVLASLEDSLGELDRMLLPASLDGGPVVVVPSGSLARLPWGMLPRLRGVALAQARSVGAWSAGAVGLGRAPGVAVAAGPGLALAGRECEAVAGSWSVADRVPAEPAAVRDALAAYDVVHIAAHGRHREDNPLFSSLRLHGGSLFAHELEHVPLRASLVVLSACGAGRGRLRPGDEALGLTSSLLALGVGAVVAPLTDVPDDVACRTMAAMHRRLAAGDDGPAALAAASGGLLDRSFTWFGAAWRAGAPA